MMVYAARESHRNIHICHRTRCDDNGANDLEDNASHCEYPRDLVVLLLAWLLVSIPAREVHGIMLNAWNTYIIIPLNHACAGSHEFMLYIYTHDWCAHAHAHAWTWEYCIFTCVHAEISRCTYNIFMEAAGTTNSIVYHGMVQTRDH